MNKLELKKSIGSLLQNYSKQGGPAVDDITVLPDKINGIGSGVEAMLNMTLLPSLLKSDELTVEQKEQLSDLRSTYKKKLHDTPDNSFLIMNELLHKIYNIVDQEKYTQLCTSSPPGKELTEAQNMCCGFCGTKFPVSRCPCKNVYYCNQTCQKEHWHVHKKHEAHVQYQK